MSIQAMLTAALMAGLLLLLPATPGQAATPCGAGTYTYTFRNSCAETIFVGQNGPGAASTPPVSNNWALAPTCEADSQCTAGQSCSKQDGNRIGQCTCSLDSDRPGSAPCVNNRCSTDATFCMPQGWSSGTFWPRTGCVLNSGTGVLTCTTGQCGGSPRTQSGGLIDCGSAGSGQSGPTPPIVLFEPTTTSSSGNYDVSLNNGYNVQMRVTPVGGSGNLCTSVGCESDLNIPGRRTSCPANLVFHDPTTQKAIGCYQPQDACASSGAGPVVTPPAGLACTSISKDALGHTPDPTINCQAQAGGPVGYIDMYEAKNASDGHENTEATSNGGTPTAYSIAGCPLGSEFTTQFVAGAACQTDADCASKHQKCSGGQCTVVPPPGVGVCVRFQNGILVPDWGCSANNIGATCGQYKGTYADALGYTCQAVTYSGGTTYPCVPPTISGLGKCDTTQATEGFYPGVGGLFNPSWVQAGVKAGGGVTPYYETFRNACSTAYTWQYDDVSGGRSCTFAGEPSNGFEVEFCPFSIAEIGAPQLSASVLPGTRSIPVGGVASAFATIINSGTANGVGCSIAPSPGVTGATFSYQTTNSSTNAPTGSPNTPVNIPVGGSQTFVIAFSATGAFAQREVRFAFQCSNSAAAPVVAGLNTFLVSATFPLVPDIVALVETPSHDGIVSIPGPNGTGVLSVATANVGGSAQITVSADTGETQLPLTLTLCQTNPSTGACISPVQSSLVLQINRGDTPTFGVFAQANGNIPFDPANTRIFFRMTDQGVTRGLTSAAVRTQAVVTASAISSSP